MLAIELGFSDSHNMHKLQTCPLGSSPLSELLDGCLSTLQALFVHVRPECSTTAANDRLFIRLGLTVYLERVSDSLSYILLLTHLEEMGGNIS